MDGLFVIKKDGYQTVTITNGGIYEIVAYGAGNVYGLGKTVGFGAIVSGKFDLAKNSKITIVIGQMGDFKALFIINETLSIEGVA